MDPNITPLSLPPEGIYESFEALNTYTKEYTRSAGYTVIIGKSERRKGQQLKYINYKRASIERPSVLVENRQR